MSEGKHSDAYRKRIASAAWRKLRRERIIAANFECELCHVVKPDFAAFHLHHLSYERLGRERPEDLQVVCDRCHARADESRVEATRRRSARALWNARLDGWATKVYGKDWQDRADCDAIEDAFERWIESHPE